MTYDPLHPDEATKRAANKLMERRLAAGLPPRVEDPEVLDRVNAVLLRSLKRQGVIGDVA